MELKCHFISVLILVLTLSLYKLIKQYSFSNLQIVSHPYTFYSHSWQPGSPDHQTSLKRVWSSFLMYLTCIIIHDNLDYVYMYYVIYCTSNIPQFQYVLHCIQCDPILPHCIQGCSTRCPLHSPNLSNLQELESKPKPIVLTLKMVIQVHK